MGLVADLAQVAERHGAVLLVRFGSAVSGMTHARSDVDLGVLFGKPSVSIEIFSDLLRDLQRLHPGRDVDLAVLDHADPLFLKKVTESCELLYGSRRRLLELKMYAFKRYQDHRKFLAMERRYVETALREMAQR